MPVLKRMPGDAVKAAVTDNGRIRVKGHTVRFTDAEQRDLHKQFFNQETDYGIEIGWSLVGKNILIEHGLDPAFKALGVGVFDLERVDDIGIYNEGWLRNRQDYVAMLQEMRSNKRIDWDDATIDRKADIAYAAIKTFCELNPQWSSGALPQDVEVDEDTGHIKSWKRIEASMTLTPAEPNGTEIAAVRSAFQELKSLLSLSTDDPQHTGESAPGGETVRKDATASADLEPPQANADATTSPANNVPEGNKMDPNQAMIDAIAQAVAAQVLAGVSQLLSKEGQAAEVLPAETEVVAALRADPPKPEEKPEDVAKSFAEKAYKFVMSAVEKRRDAAKSAATITNDFLKRTMPAVDDLPAGGNGNGRNGRIEMTDLKYARFSAGELALGVLMAQAPMKAAGIRANPNISEDYIRNMNGKAHDLAWRDNAGLSAEHKHALKSIVPYKANELDASNLVGQGYEWVSQFWSSTIWEAARFAPTLYDKMVAKGMHVEEVGQGADSVYFPTEESDPVVYSSPQANSVDSTGRPEVTANISPFSTGRVQLTPRELKLATAFTVILEEDSIINIVKQVNSQINKKMLETRDQVIINGDTATAANTNINLIDGTPGTGLNAPYYLNSNGLRKLPLVTNTTLKRDGGALTIADYLATLGLLAAVLRTNKAESLFIVDPGTELATMALPELATLDVAGRYATIENGEIRGIYGREVIATGFLPLTDTTGKVSATAANNLYGTILAVYAPYWAFGWKRQITIETDRDILSGSNVYVASMRMGIIPRGTTGSAASYHLTV